MVTFTWYQLDNRVYLLKCNNERAFTITFYFKHGKRILIFNISLIFHAHINNFFFAFLVCIDPTRSRELRKSIASQKFVHHCHQRSPKLCYSCYDSHFSFIVFSADCFECYSKDYRICDQHMKAKSCPGKGRQCYSLRYYNEEEGEEEHGFKKGCVEENTSCQSIRQDYLDLDYKECKVSVDSFENRNNKYFISYCLQICDIFLSGIML